MGGEEGSGGGGGGGGGQNSSRELKYFTAIMKYMIHTKLQ